MNACVFVTVNAERAIGESEKMMDLLLQWGQQRPEVRFFLRRGRAHNLPTGKRRIPLVLQTAALTIAGMAQYQNFGFGAIPECNASVSILNNQPEKIGEFKTILLIIITVIKTDSCFYY